VIDSLIQAYEISMLALMIWREARNSSSDAQFQVGWTVRNRVDNPKWWGETYSEVITKKWQYSSMAAPGDKQLILYPSVADDRFIHCLEIAFAIYFSRYYGGNSRPKFPEADSYYDDSIKPPSWATKDKYLGMIDRFAFYNIDGSTGD
jgi:hypothetical protein